jgi:para-nitrobenzyl esterase
MDMGLTRASTINAIFAHFGTNAEAAKTAYNAAGSTDVRAVGMKVAADQLMIEPARFLAQTMSSQGVPVWGYRFAYVATSMRPQWPGAPHATEIPFVFDTVQAKHSQKFMEEVDTAEMRQTSMVPGDC